MSLKVSPILPKHQPSTQPKPKITPKVVDNTKQNNQAINRLAVRFGGDDETKPPKKTIGDFYQKILQEQPLNEKDRDNKIKIPLNLSKNATLEDYRLATDKVILQKAGYSMLNKDEVETARGLIGLKDNFNLKKLKDLDKANKLVVKTNQYFVEKAKIAGQAVLQFREYEAKLKDSNNAAGENETNRIGKDIGGLHYETFRKIGDGLVNIVPDTLNLLFGGKRGELNKSTPSFGRAKIGEMYDELAKTDAEVKIPRIDTTGISPPYKFESQMMRRNLNGIVDGEGPKAGDTISTGASIIAPLIIGKVSAPADINTLKSLGALPEVTTVPKTLPKIGKLQIEKGRKLSSSEQNFADKMIAEGKDVKARTEVNLKGIKNPDFEVDGKLTEFKYVSDMKGINADKLSARLSSRILDGGSQAPRVTLDVSKQTGMTKEIAERAVSRAFGRQSQMVRLGELLKPKLSEVRIYGKDFDITLVYKPE